VHAVRSQLGRAPLSALSAASLRLASLWRVHATVDPRLEFTGNLATSPNALEYRVWRRRCGFIGPLTGRRLATESPRRSLQAGFCWLVGVLARGLCVAPERLHGRLGALLAALLIARIDVWIQQHLASPTARGLVL